MSEKDLTPEGLEALLANLDPDRGRAAERYLEIRRRLTRLFEWRGCDHPDELTDITINRVARRLAEGLQRTSDDVYPLFYGVAHLVHKEHLRHMAKKQRVVDNWPPPPADEEENDVRLEHLRHCLGILTPQQRGMLLRYHQEEDRIRARKALCDEVGGNMNSLRIQMHRLRRKIETCIEERLREPPSAR